MQQNKSLDREFWVISSKFSKFPLVDLVGLIMMSIQEDDRNLFDAILILINRLNMKRVEQTDLDHRGMDDLTMVQMILPKL